MRLGVVKSAKAVRSWNGLEEPREEPPCHPARVLRFAPSGSAHVVGLFSVMSYRTLQTSFVSEIPPGVLACLRPGRFLERGKVPGIREGSGRFLLRHRPPPVIPRPKKPISVKTK